MSVNLWVNNENRILAMQENDSRQDKEALGCVGGHCGRNHTKTTCGMATMTWRNQKSMESERVGLRTITGYECKWAQWAWLYASVHLLMNTNALKRMDVRWDMNDTLIEWLMQTQCEFADCIHCDKPLDMGTVVQSYTWRMTCRTVLMNRL